MYDAVFSSRAFSWCVISWFYFPWKVNLRNYSSRLVIWRFCVTREETDYLTDIRDFTTLFHAILRCKSSERLESSIESVELRLCPSRFLWEQVIRNIILITCLFSWFGKTNLYICNPCSSIFSVREPWQRPPSPPPLCYFHCQFIHCHIRLYYGGCNPTPKVFQRIRLELGPVHMEVGDPGEVGYLSYPW